MEGCEFSMNAIESAILKEMDETLFTNVTTDDFSFVDSLVDQQDLDKLTNKECTKNAND